MKTILFSLFSLVTFAQTQLPDSLFLIDGRTTACLITEVNDKRIYFVYNNNVDETIVTDALSRAYIDSLGDIYESGKGFIKSQDEINNFVDQRMREIENKKALETELQRIDLTRVNGETKNYRIRKNQFKMRPYNKWSFGVLYVPYYTSRNFYISNSGVSQINVYRYLENQANLEAQLAYALLPQFRITLEAGYSASIEDVNYDYHNAYPYSNSYSTQSGYESTNGMKKLDFTLGAKYYLDNFISDKVSVFAIFGVGKQFAFAEDKYKDLYAIPVPNLIDENNQEEFMEDLNSPWHFNIGFGAEYFFNESLSLNSSIKLLYSTCSATYKTRQVSINYTRISSQEFTFNEFVTKIGLGLNFYF